ncbi:MAG TPA: hypothetical protein VHS28_05665 [Chloroflexota bacterium]|nr:hypothetical protein [Chloroflexota bacterium]
MGGLPRVVIEASGGQETLYVYGLGLAYEVRPTGRDATYHSDALGSTRVVTDDAGNPVSAYNYDAYGAVRAQAGEGRGFTYTGERLDTETSLVFPRARCYDAQAGRTAVWPALAPAGAGGTIRAGGITRCGGVAGRE